MNLLLDFRYEKLSLHYAVKLKNNTSNPTYENTFTPRYINYYNSKPSAIRSFGLRIKEAVAHVLDNDNIAPFLIPNIPPWMINEPEIDLSLRELKKRSY